MIFSKDIEIHNEKFLKKNFYNEPSSTGISRPVTYSDESEIKSLLHQNLWFIFLLTIFFILKKEFLDDCQIHHIVQLLLVY